MRGRLEQMMQRVDAWSPRLAIGVGLAGFFVGSLLLTRLPVWGFGVGCCLLSAAIVWLALSAKPVFKVVYPAAPPPTLVRPNPPSLVEPLEMIELPGGEFWMGSPRREPERYPDEIRHRVKVSSFVMAKFPVTQKLYQEVMEQSPSYFKGESLPVESVSWFDAVRFCNKLSARVGLRPCYRVVEPAPKKAEGEEAQAEAQPEVEWDQTADGYRLPTEAEWESADGEAAQAESQPEVEWDQTANGYRLPTEAEWEYACRARTETAYSFGDDPAQLHEYAWFSGDSGNRTHEVGTRKANGWGLYDLHGNVWEWCWDWYGEYQVTDDNDKSVGLVCPIGPPSGDGRVLRGGSFGGEPRFLRSAGRDWVQPEVRYGGFRCVRGSERGRRAVGGAWLDENVCA